jgi:hypothetical protein
MNEKEVREPLNGNVGSDSWRKLSADAKRTSKKYRDIVSYMATYKRYVNINLCFEC